MILGGYMEIKLLGIEEILQHRESIVSLLCENTIINLPQIPNPEQLALEDYDDLISYAKDGSLILIGALDEGILVGILWAYKRIFLNEPRIHLRDIIVDQSMRGKGAGQRMENLLIELVREKGLQKVELMVTASNEGAVNFYRRLGYCGTRILMEKEI